MSIESLLLDLTTAVRENTDSNNKLLLVMQGNKPVVAVNEPSELQADAAKAVEKANAAAEKKAKAAAARKEKAEAAKKAKAEEAEAEEEPEEEPEAEPEVEELSLIHI